MILCLPFQRLKSWKEGPGWYVCCFFFKQKVFVWQEEGFKGKLCGISKGNNSHNSHYYEIMFKYDSKRMLLQG